MSPVIKTFAPFTVVGLSDRFISALSPNANNFQIIPKIWSDYIKRSGEIKSRLSPTDYGVVSCLTGQDLKSHPDEMRYLAGAAVSDTTQIPLGMTSVAIPGGKYAVFTHIGPVQNLGQTMNHIYRERLPQSGLKMRSDTPHLEIYDHRFHPGSPDSQIDLCVPIE